MKHYITISKKYHYENTALERSVMIFTGVGIVGVGGGGGRSGVEGFKLPLQNPKKG